MENATQEDALEVVETEEVTEEQPVEEDLTASVNPISAREKALEEIYNRRREEEHVEEDSEQEVVNSPDTPVWYDGEKWLTKVKVNGEEVDVPFDSLKSSHQKDKASQEKFQSAAIKERELLYREQQIQEQLRQLNSQPPTKDVEQEEETSDVDDIVEKYHEALFQDDAAEAAKLLRTLL